MLAVLCGFLLCGRAASPQEDLGAADKRIFQEVREHNQLMENLEYLSDTTGPRLTGSAQLLQAVNWAAAISRRYQLENVHLEAWKIAHSWQRGPAQARIVSPVARNITIVAAGWSPATQGQVRGRVVYLAATNAEELQKYRGALKGAFVLYEEPAEFNSQPQELAGSPVETPSPVPDPNLPTPGAKFDRIRMDFLEHEEVAALLWESNKNYGLLNTGLAGSKYEIGKVPVGILTHEDYALIWRLLKKGPVEIEVALDASFSQGPVEVYNTVAEIRGSEIADEVVILCAHLDSWDLASGATDDATGVASVIEAARALKALNLRARRTIRVVLFTGEEQGRIGSREYVKQHREELGKISAVLADDTGTGRILTIRLNQNFAAHKTVDVTLAPMRELKLLEPEIERSYGSDYASFNEVGVPGFSCVGSQSDYFETHHSQADTFDKVREDGVIQAAQLLAGWACNTAQLPTLIPRD